ncbi:UNKNOWN [Stylonychia lemnae]|uniref:Transmembrane protein n=1 Tax=Stylonychia lemnae TaxID=5949 RepID=A0A078AA98_STYLE|nr:UNKNOWN [Stylonychia lemnae]|eukprot:CDW77733.1 UNKNOWN [Stylonychia lemnae]
MQGLKGYIYLIILSNILLPVLSQKCFGVGQLPLVFGSKQNINSKVNVLSYDFENDYAYFGGQFGDIPMIGFFNNQLGFERLLWLNSYKINGDLYLNQQLSEIEALNSRNTTIYATARSANLPADTQGYHYIFKIDFLGRYPKGIQIIRQISEVLFKYTIDFGPNNTVIFATQEQDRLTKLYILSEDLTLVLAKYTFQKTTRIGVIMSIPQTNKLFLSGAYNLQPAIGSGLFFYQIDLNNQLNTYTVPAFDITSKFQYALILSIVEYIDLSIIGCLQRRGGNQAIGFYIYDKQGTNKVYMKDISEDYKTSSDVTCVGISNYTAAQKFVIFSCWIFGNKWLQSWIYNYFKSRLPSSIVRC